MDLKNIISSKAHDSSVKKLTNIPSSLKEELTFDFFNSVASALSAITRDHFNYTGKITQEDNTLRITFTSSSQSDSIDLLIKYQEKGYKFVNINDKLKKALDEKPKEDDITTKNEIKPTEITKNKIKPTEITKNEIKPVEIVKNIPQEPKLDPALLNLMFKEVEKEKKDQMTKLLFKTLDTLQVREEFKKKEKLIDQLIEKELND